MTNTAEIELRVRRTFDLRQAAIEAEQLGYTNVEEVVADAQMLFNENPDTTDWKALRHYYVIIQGVLTEKRYLFAEFFLEVFSFAEADVATEIDLRDSVAPELSHVGVRENRDLPSIPDEQADPEGIFVEASPNELEAEATKLLETASRAQVSRSTSPLNRKADTGPWLKSGNGEVPITVVEIEEPPKYVAEQLPRQTDAELRKLALELGLMSLKTPRTKNSFGEYDDGEAWREDALCATTDPEAFFPEKGGSTREAKRVCAACDVRKECLEFALDHDERFGIWGGLSERERRRLKKQLQPGDISDDDDDDESDDDLSA